MSRWVGRSDDFVQCLEIRRAVFIEEQGVSVEDEVDGQDSKALHFLARDNTVPVGTARILILDEIGKIGRVCVLAPYRGRGHAKALMGACLSHLKADERVNKAKLGAQISALGLYESLGFQAYGADYMDAGILHRDMVLTL